ncbi:RES family NAD+ phosphorylase [Aequorivita capsosiphonis]|uniref:RES family NAD+ phosphorylase n=1 Tax=Aequorivita capsosiphonis TaxID=487317 RepID=UPI00047BB638|nr:RES family NAD+ phosphorylase [Aequorivita capsosiphonis]
MRIYRITKTHYIEDLSGEGARLYGGRWNMVGDAMLYFAQNLSLSLLEIIVHVDYAELPLEYSFIEVEIPDSSIKEIQSIDFIKPKWSTEEAVNQLQMFGSKWLKKSEALAMKVPSAVLHQEHNILINPSHKDFGKLKIIRKDKMDFDPRLLR